jgi:hypothetical protein
MTVSARVILFGAALERFEGERLLRERQPAMHVRSVAERWEFLEQACRGEFDVAVVLRGPISDHDERMAALAGLRRDGFAGRILAAGSFLTEKQDALGAGADYAFDPVAQALESVVAAALYRPRVAADHPYLRFLFVKDWLCLEAVADQLPEPPPDLLLVATSRHRDASFYPRLAEYSKRHRELQCILVEDEADDELRAEALASGVQPYVDLAAEGLLAVAELGRRLAREAWLSKVSKA